MVSAWKATHWPPHGHVPSELQVRMQNPSDVVPVDRSENLVHMIKKRYLNRVVEDMGLVVAFHDVLGECAHALAWCVPHRRWPESALAVIRPNTGAASARSRA